MAVGRWLPQREEQNGQGLGASYRMRCRLHNLPCAEPKTSLSQDKGFGEKNVCKRKERGMVCVCEANLAIPSPQASPFPCHII